MRKLKYVKLFENFQLHEGTFNLFGSKNAQEEETKDFQRDLRELKKDPNVLFLKQVTGTKYTYVVEIKSSKQRGELGRIDTKSTYNPGRGDEDLDQELDDVNKYDLPIDDLKWHFEVRPITTIDGERIGLPYGTTKITKQVGSDMPTHEITIDLTGVFPGAKSSKRKIIYYRGSTGYSSDEEYKVDEDDMTKILNWCQKNDQSGLLKRLTDGDVKNLHMDIDFDDLDVGNFMESRRYKRYSRR